MSTTFRSVRSQLFPRLQRPEEGPAGVFVAGQLEVGLVRLGVRESFPVMPLQLPLQLIRSSPPCHRVLRRRYRA